MDLLPLSWPVRANVWTVPVYILALAGVSLAHDRAARADMAVVPGGGPERLPWRAEDGKAGTAAGSGRALHLGYDIYIGGVHGFSFDAEFRREGTGYRIAAAGRSQGMLSWFWDWRGAIDARGAVAGEDGVEPGTYDLRSQFRKKRKHMVLGFYGENAYGITRDPPDTLHRARKRELPATLPAGTLDPFSASLALARKVAASGTCADTALPVFDGDRRYDLLFAEIRRERIATAGYTVFDGEALHCEVTMKRISGFRKQNVTVRYWDEDDRDPPQLWLARLVPDMPPVPVKLVVDLNVGYLIAYLARADFNGTPLYSDQIRPPLQQARNE